MASKGIGRILSLDEIKQTVVPILKQDGIKSAFLFGSYAKGTATESSDIDLIVDSPLDGLTFFGTLANLFDVYGYGNVDLYDFREIIPGTDFKKK